MRPEPWRHGQAPITGAAGFSTSCSSVVLHELCVCYAASNFDVGAPALFADHPMSVGATRK
jgi:hypothetical protein